MKKLIPFALFLSPLLAFAQASDVEDLIDIVGNLLQSIVPILIIVAIIVFFYGLVRYLLAAGDPEGKASGLKLMIAGVVVLFVMVSVWGLVGILQGTFADNTGADVGNPAEQIDF